MAAALAEGQQLLKERDVALQTERKAAEEAVALAAQRKATKKASALEAKRSAEEAAALYPNPVALTGATPPQVIEREPAVKRSHEPDEESPDQEVFIKVITYLALSDS